MNKSWVSNVSFKFSCFFYRNCSRNGTHEWTRFATFISEGLLLRVRWRLPLFIRMKVSKIYLIGKIDWKQEQHHYCDYECVDTDTAMKTPITNIWAEPLSLSHRTTTWNKASVKIWLKERIYSTRVKKSMTICTEWDSS